MPEGQEKAERREDFGSARVGAKTSLRSARFRRVPRHLPPKREG